jgi:hypothetical protein
MHKRSVENEIQVRRIMSKGGLAGMWESRSQSQKEKNREYFACLIKTLHDYIFHQNAKSQLGDFINFLAFSLHHEPVKDFLTLNEGSTYGTYISGPAIEEILS